MNLYTSDLHFGHANVIRFDNRPFQTVEEMDKELIKYWNEKVTNNDDVWILGDFCYRSGNDPTYYLKQLKGHKHLIIGNHDKVTLKNKEALRYLESIDDNKQISDIYNNEPVHVIMCHYPIASWNGMHRGSYHIYGHIHNNIDDTFYFMKKKDRALNAGCMINNYVPVNINELIINNKNFENNFYEEEK